MDLKAYLQFTRAHAAPLEVIPSVLGAVLATGGLLNRTVLLWGVAGLLYHNAGYSMNSYVDWRKGYDKDDDYKQHHPLNTGKLSILEGKVISYGFLSLSFFYYAYLIGFDITALSVMLLGVITGGLYNTIGKQTRFRFIFISIAHTTLFAIPFIAEDGSKSIVFALGCLYVFLWVSFQISVSEAIKDITDIEEPNFMRDVTGFDVGEIGQAYDFNPHFKTVAYSVSLKIVGAGIGLIIYSELQAQQGYTLADFILGALCIVSISGAVALVSLKEFYQRDYRLRMISLIEALSVFIFIIAFQPIIEWAGVVLLISLSLAWVIGSNILAWETILAPET